MCLKGQNDLSNTNNILKTFTLTLLSFSFEKDFNYQENQIRLITGVTLAKVIGRAKKNKKYET